MSTEFGTGKRNMSYSERLRVFVCECVCWDVSARSVGPKRSSCLAAAPTSYNSLANMVLGVSGYFFKIKRMLASSRPEAFDAFVFSSETFV